MWLSLVIKNTHDFGDTLLVTWEWDGEDLWLRYVHIYT